MNRRGLWALVAAAAVAWAGLQSGLLEGDLINTGGWALVERFLRAALHPATSGDFLRRAAAATLTTLAFAACGTFLSLIIGAVGGVLAAESWWRAVFGWSADRRRVPLIGRRAPWVVVRAVLAVPRAIHEIVWGLFFVAIVGLDPLVGVLAIAIPFGAICAKVFSEILDEADTRPLGVLLNRGVRPLKAYLYTQVPAAFDDLLSYAFYRFECSIRSAAVLGIIGAGGLGYEIFLSLQSLRYEQMWTFLIALILLTGLTDLWSGLVRRRVGSSHRIDIQVGELGPSTERLRGLRREVPGSTVATEGADAGAGTAEAESSPPRRSPTRDRVLQASLAGAGLMVVLSFWHVGASFGQLGEARTLEMLLHLVSEAWPPGLGGLTPGRLLELSLLTLAMSILAIAGAAAAGVLFSFPAASSLSLPGGVLLGERSRPAARAVGVAVWAASRAALLVLRAVPAPIWALVLLFVFFPGILPGAVALGLYTAGVLGRLMAEVVENLDARPLRALKAQGASGLQVFLYGVLPATAPRFLSYVLYRWEVAIRATVMVGLVGAGGLGRVLTEQLSSFDYAAVLTTLGCYVALTFLVDMVSAAARRDLR